jgi:mRNA interferase RelE/StbE
VSEPARRWTVKVKHEAEKVLRRLPRDLAERVVRAMLALETDPRPHGCKRLKSHDELYRVRVGEWRITYTVQDDKLIVLVLEIAPRGGAYKNIN